VPSIFSVLTFALFEMMPRTILPVRGFLCA